MATFSCTNTRNDALKTRQASQQHKKSVLEELGVQVGPNGNPLVGAPPFEVFSEVLAKLQSGLSARNIDRGGTRGRLKNIRFCVLEAKQEMDREFMKSAATMVLLRDERHGRLLLRFATCTRDLEVRRGTLGALRDYGSPAAENSVKCNRAGVHIVLRSQVGEAPNHPNHDRVGGAGGGS
jgi:hypothetical protein